MNPTKILRQTTSFIGIAILVLAVIATPIGLIKTPVAKAIDFSSSCPLFDKTTGTTTTPSTPTTPTTPGTPPGPVKNGKIPVPYYTQGSGAPWGGNSYGCGTTIGQAGCGITSLAMVISYWTGKKILPSETAKVSMKHGWRLCGSGTAWEAMTGMPKLYGLQAKNISNSWSTVKSYLDKGYPVIQSHGPGCFTQHGHFVVLIGYSGNTVYVNDPNGKHRSYQSGVSLSCVKNSVKQSWAIWK